MAEIEVPVRTYAVDRVCSTCEKGRMRPTGENMLMSMPPQFQHKCDNDECGAKGNFSERYPFIRHELMESKVVTSDGNG